MTALKILAGRRRYYAARVIEQEAGSFPALNCDLRENCSDAEALEISLIENVAREDADELTEYESYAGLIRLGRSPAEIAKTFGRGGKGRAAAVGACQPHAAHPRVVPQ